MRRRAVRASAVDDQVHLARLRHDRTGTGRNFSLGHVRHHMHAVDHVHMRVFQRPLVDHALGAAGRLLRGLEQQHHVVHELRPVIRQPPGERQQVRHVAVVPAGVHEPRVLGGEGAARLLLHRQRVDVRAEGHHAPLPIAAEHRAHARLRKDAHLVRCERLQLLQDVRLRLLLAVSQLGNPVQRTPVRAHNSLIGGSLPLDFLHIHPFFVPFALIHGCTKRPTRPFGCSPLTLIVSQLRKNEKAARTIPPAPAYFLSGGSAGLTILRGDAIMHNTSTFQSESERQCRF